MCIYIDLKDPPIGTVEAKYVGSSSFIRWAPGNGLIYVLIADPIPPGIEKHVGGSVMLSVCRHDGKTYTSYPGNPSGLYHLSFVDEKWGKDMTEEGVYYLTALLNWTLFGGEDVADSYALELFQEARKKWR